MKPTYIFTAVPLSIAIAAAITSCGGGSSSSGSSSSTSTGGTGSYTLAVTDAPVDDAEKVVIQITGVTLKPKGSTEINFEFEEVKSIDFLDLQNGVSENLLSNQSIPAGDYNWVRLQVNAEEDGTMDSYIEFSDTSQREIRVPSGSQTGLKLVSGFTVSENGSSGYTIDFDLRKSLTDPGGTGSVIFKPTLRLVENTSVGSITGTIDASLVTSACADSATEDGSVYAFEGTDVTPTDIQGSNSDPLSSSLVSFADSTYSFTLAFLPVGDYTVAYTCEAQNDDPEAADTITFSQQANATVTANAATEITLSAP